LGQNYPSFQPSYSHEDLVEHFLLTPGELESVLKCRGDANRCGMALLLKTLSRIGRLTPIHIRSPAQPALASCVAISRPSHLLRF
jgi:hypothetical protein